ncbi:MAG TPA: glycosyltransferase family 39 protein [Pirellulales bacterium]|nr:glycosyltransferase family 39 protein [Pirellulales bacterium]
MIRPDKRPLALDWVWFLVCALASSSWCVSAASQLSATFDEPLYLARGLERWRTGSHSGLIRLGTMPLPVDVDTLPVYLWECWRGVRFDLSADLDRILPLARLGTLLFWWGLLFYGWLAARRLAGPWGGRLAVAWLACEPNLLAHASLATTDIAISACLLALAYHFAAGREGNWRWRVALPGLCFGAALLAKASGLVFGPLLMAVVEFDRLARNGQLRALFAAQPATAPMGLGRSIATLLAAARAVSLPFRRDLVQVAGIGFAVMFVYCGCDWRPEPSFVAWAEKLPAGGFHDAMLWIAEHLRIFSNGAEGLVRQIKHNMKGHHGAYLLGEVHPRAVWYYFPLALSIKLSLPLLFAPVALIARRRREALNWACLAALALLVFSLTCRVQIGIRLVLPLIAMLVVGLSAAIAEATAQTRSLGGRRFLACGAALAVAWTTFSACQVWPHGLCYTNELWGGVSQGYLCLSDSNYDWGQGVKELARWRREQGLPQLDVWYFGTDPAANEAPLRNLPLHVLPLNQPQDVLAYVQGDYVAVGATLLYGTTTSEAPHRKAVEFFRGQQPIARTTTFLIFDVGRRSLAARPAPPAERQALRIEGRP